LALKAKWATPTGNMSQRRFYWYRNLEQSMSLCSMGKSELSLLRRGLGGLLLNVKIIKK
jgi:hypothetical protein